MPKRLAWGVCSMRLPPLLLLLSILLTLTTAVGAQERVALVIGNAQYAHAPRLANPLSDAADIGAALNRLGFAVTKLENANYTALRQALLAFTRAASAADIAVVFYAGHGIEVDQRNFLVPVDAKLASDQDVEFETVPLELVMRSVGRAAGLRLVILDACRENPFAVSMQRAGAKRSVSRGLARVEPAGETLVAYAAKEGTVASDGEGRNSPYSEALLRHLEEPGLEVGLLFRKVRDAVLALTGGRQEPFVYGSLSSRGVYLTARVEESDPKPSTADTPTERESVSERLTAEQLATQRLAAERELLFWESVKDSTDPADLQAYLDRYPGGTYEVLARNRLRRPADSPEQATMEPGRRFRDCPDCPEMVVVPAGSCMMGSPTSEEGRDYDEGPQHWVTIANPFAVGVHEVTRGEFARFVRETGHAAGNRCQDFTSGRTKWVGRNWRNPGFEQTDRHPVVCVSWQDAQAYVKWLSRETGERYRLLSESEWEYTARAGTRTAWYWGESESGQCRHANGADASSEFDYGVNCNDGHAWTSPVGTYRENDFGLYDVLGNVQEWVQDWSNDSYDGVPTDGRAWKGRDEAVWRVIRGGSWGTTPRYLRAANRNSQPYDVRKNFMGFRIARTLTP